MARHERTDREWALLAEYFPPRPRRRGGRWRDDRAMANAAFWRLNTGAAWRDLPERYGPWQTGYHRFNALQATGAIDRMVERLQHRLDAAGLIDHALYSVDGTNVRAVRAAGGGKTRPPGVPADHALGHSRGGFGRKVHLVCDGGGLPLAVVVTAGQRQECTQFEAVMDAVRIRRRGRPRTRPRVVAGERDTATGTSGPGCGGTASGRSPPAGGPAARRRPGSGSTGRPTAGGPGWSSAPASPQTPG